MYHTKSTQYQNYVNSRTRTIALAGGRPIKNASDSRLPADVDLSAVPAELSQTVDLTETSEASLEVRDQVPPPATAQVEPQEQSEKVEVPSEVPTQAQPLAPQPAAAPKGPPTRTAPAAPAPTTGQDMLQSMLDKLDLDSSSTTGQAPIVPGIKPYEAPPADRFTADECKKVIAGYAHAYGLTIPEAYHSIAFWCQTGGYVKSVPNKKHKINGRAEEELTKLREICGQVRNGGTVRQLARKLAPVIASVALQCGYVGHLHKSLKPIRPEMTGVDWIYCCEYYFGLSITPRIVNEAIAERIKARSSKAKTNNTKNKKKKGGKKK